MGVQVVDSTRRHSIPTGRVSVAITGDETDAQVAAAAGYGLQHFGYDVTRYDDGAAVVALWND